MCVTCKLYFRVWFQFSSYESTWQELAETVSSFYGCKQFCQESIRSLKNGGKVKELNVVVSNLIRCTDTDFTSKLLFFVIINVCLIYYSTFGNHIDKVMSFLNFYFLCFALHFYHMVYKYFVHLFLLLFYYYFYYYY